jgi:hypothetical protein
MTPSVYPCRVCGLAVLLTLGACGGAVFEASEAADASFEGTLGDPDSGARQGYTDGGIDAFVGVGEAGVDSGADASVQLVDAASDAPVDATPPPPDGPPATCAEANGTIGCCYGTVAYTCNTGPLTAMDCSQLGQPAACGWSTWSNGAGYDCIAEGTADAAAYPGPPQYPRQCQ